MSDALSDSSSIAMGTPVFPLSRPVIPFPVAFQLILRLPSFFTLGPAVLTARFSIVVLPVEVLPTMLTKRVSVPIFSDR